MQGPRWHTAGGWGRQGGPTFDFLTEGVQTCYISVNTLEDHKSNPVEFYPYNAAGVIDSVPKVAVFQDIGA